MRVRWPGWVSLRAFKGLSYSTVRGCVIGRGQELIVWLLLFLCGAGLVVVVVRDEEWTVGSKESDGEGNEFGNRPDMFLYLRSIFIHLLPLSLSLSY